MDGKAAAAEALIGQLATALGALEAGPLSADAAARARLEAARKKAVSALAATRAALDRVREMRDVGGGA